MDMDMGKGVGVRGEFRGGDWGGGWVSLGVFWGFLISWALSLFEGFFLRLSLLVSPGPFSWVFLSRFSSLSRSLSPFLSSSLSHRVLFFLSRSSYLFGVSISISISVLYHRRGRAFSISLSIPYLSTTYICCKASIPLIPKTYFPPAQYAVPFNIPTNRYIYPAISTQFNKKEQ